MHFSNINTLKAAVNRSSNSAELKFRTECLADTQPLPLFLIFNEAITS
jgi:hypothetical protein